ncbi:SGNH/GDSL hydrolase family protein [Nocardioides zeicaulis]|uniref:SGNH/GDSL hydrolase family protein n=1 Tax=Nocardioides zeicaulis TaxID=1776857 RepID=A0ABV6DZ71_9ACTN
MNPPPPDRRDGPRLRFALLGDSIAWGQGAARPDDRLGPRLTGALQARGHDVEHRVLAVPGARSRDLGGQVEAALAWRPTLALVVVGANDLTHREPLDMAVGALADAVRALRGAGAEVVVAPAPDLGAVPHVPAFLRDAVRRASADLRQRQADVVRREGGRVADPDGRASHAFAADAALFSADRFHPSSAGYAVIADAILPALEETARRVS